MADRGIELGLPEREVGESDGGDAVSLLLIEASLLLSDWVSLLLIEASLLLIEASLLLGDWLMKGEGLW